MPAPRKDQEAAPLSVVTRREKDKNPEAHDIDMAENDQETTIEQLRHTLKGLRQQVEQLSQSMVDIGDRASKTVVEGVVAGKDKAVSTVETHPFYAILAAAAVAFALGRLSVTPERGVAERAYDRLHDLALRLEPRFSEAVRNRIR
jgi:ElaB/YqjD/DUF883 family membrane-anchored ribosome-binding protein